MKRSIVATFIAIALLPVAVAAYDPTIDQNTVRALGERIDGDVNQGLLPTDRAALLRAEIDVTQKLITNGDSQATAMLADVDRDLAAYDNSVDGNEANRDLLYHIGDTITVAMRDDTAWQFAIQNPDIVDVKQKGALNAAGVQGAFLAKAPGYTGLTLTDPTSGRHVQFRFYIVEKAAGN